MTPEALLALLDYHYWARDRLLDAVEEIMSDHFHKDMGNGFPSIRDTLLHIVFAEFVWRSRWEGESLPEPFDPKDFETVQDVCARWIEEEHRVRRFVNQVGPDGLNHVFRYTELNGQADTVRFLAVLAACGQPCCLSPRAGHHDVAPTRGPAAG